MKHAFKLLTKIFFILSIFILQINFSLALDVCPGQGATLIWGVTGTTTSCGIQQSSGLNGNECNFSGNSGTKPIAMPGNSGACSVSFQCQNGAVLSNLGSASLSVVNREECCNTGSQVGLTVWNGTTSVAPATWTDYCVPISEANGNVGYTWQVNNATPPAYREKAPKTACNPCPSGQTWNNQSGAAAVCAAAPGICTNGATNFSACDACPAGQQMNTSSPSQCVCSNGATIGSACATCPSGQSFNNLSVCAVVANAPTITVTRTPVGGVVGTPYTVSWSSSNATQVNFNCSGTTAYTAGWSGNMALNGSSNGIFLTTDIGTTNCSWQAIGAGDTATAGRFWVGASVQIIKARQTV